jgi:enterochelin esterase-like enzyme
MNGGGSGTGGAMGGMSGGGAAGASGSGGGGSSAGGSAGATSCGGLRANLKPAESIPQQFREPVANAGRIVKVTYPNYYYTDLTAGQTGDPSRFVLQRRTTAIMKPANVYLPYGHSVNSTYPVIFVLHGITDNENTWLERGSPHPAVLIDNLIAAGQIRPIIAVFPNGNSSATYTNRDFSNQAGYYFFANELVNDLMPFIETQYSAARHRDCRALTGFSMGGMQTINTGLCQSLEHIAWFGALAAAPTSYGSTQVAEYVGLENPGANPVRYFYNVVGASDSTAGSSHQAAVQDLTNRSQHFTSENFFFHRIAGGHDYVVASVGLYNLLRISFPR